MGFFNPVALFKGHLCQRLGAQCRLACGPRVARAIAAAESGKLAQWRLQRHHVNLISGHKGREFPEASDLPAASPTAAVVVCCSRHQLLFLLLLVLHVERSKPALVGGRG